jgi:hypothetical protein
MGSDVEVAKEMAEFDAAAAATREEEKDAEKQARESEAINKRSTKKLMKIA